MGGVSDVKDAERWGPRQSCMGQPSICLHMHMYDCCSAMTAGGLMLLQITSDDNAYNSETYGLSAQSDATLVSRNEVTPSVDCQDGTGSIDSSGKMSCQSEW